MNEIILYCYNCKCDVTVTALSDVLYADENVIRVDADYQCDKCNAIIPKEVNIEVGWPDDW